MAQHRRLRGAILGLVGMAAVGLLLTGAVGAQQPPAPPGPKASLLTPEDRAAMGQIFWHRLQEKLGLSDQQATEIHSLLDAQRTTAHANVQNLRAARQQLKSILGQPTVDRTAVQAAATQVKTLQAAVFDAHLQTELAVRAKLTPEQWQQWQTLRHGMGHRGMHRGRGFGPGM